MTAAFTPDTLKFLKDLARHNNREWFLKNKPRYEAAVRGPSLAFIAALAAPLRKISPQLVADPRPVGGSLFRIHRDTRFSGDKTPYKTHAGMTFFHARTRDAPRADDGGEGRGRLDAPVYYLHLQPGASFVGGGLWHPQSDSVRRVRDYMVGNPRSWKQATRSAAFRRSFELGGESLVRPPRGYDPEHELIEDLKRKDWIASAQLSDAQVLSPRFQQDVLRSFRQLAPMMDWLCGALDLEF
ncbi:MAG TPA: DUF2461 domain-containing protein [Solimonas sp.]|nr:DUF2461 domain-containing protein [Solimonas sp.]